MQGEKQDKREYTPEQKPQSKEISFKGIFPFLSKRRKEFFKSDISSIINTGNLFDYCQLIGEMQSKDLLTYNYKKFSSGLWKQ